jgi:hypothetical protein
MVDPYISIYGHVWSGQPGSGQVKYHKVRRGL